MVEKEKITMHRYACLGNGTTVEAPEGILGPYIVRQPKRHKYTVVDLELDRPQGDDLELQRTQCPITGATIYVYLKKVNDGVTVEGTACDYCDQKQGAIIKNLE